MLGRAETAKRGNRVSAVGMLIAVVATLLAGGFDYTWIVVGLVIGAAIGAVAARRVQMTGMPEMVALLNGSGGLASMLVGWAEYVRSGGVEPFSAVAIVLTVLIGGVAASGSVIAFAKLSGRMDGKPFLFRGAEGPERRPAGGGAARRRLGGGRRRRRGRRGRGVVVAFARGARRGARPRRHGRVPIGGADMPIVVSLLNSYSGVAAAAAGFVIDNNVLVVAGSLVGASGLILTNIMCKAMNRSLANVLFGGFGATITAGTAAMEGEVKPLTPDDAYFILEAASSVIVVPGYGMAVAQAQHAVKELADQLIRGGAEVRYAIHPVAGRMPGHMNVLLAEANVPYEQLVEPEDVNPTMETVDVAIVIGANDVVNPAAKEDPSSPLYGMPIIEVDRARTTFVLKRSMNPGFSGVDNALFLKDNTRMIFGDAKATLNAMVSAFKEA
jgi:H+-translocating NAD(P) transhydrogenase subunit beta